MKNKILSFFIPSRGRIDILKHTIINLTNVFKENINEIEIIIKLDLDDLESFKILEESFDVEIKYIISDRVKGYLSLSEFMSQCYKLSDSYFFILYNDDATINNHYNLIDNLRNVKDVISISTESPTSHFPILHYKIIEITGGFHNEVVYFDGHYDNVKFALPIENQFDFQLEYSHHSQWPHSIYERKNVESKQYHIPQGERYFVDYDSNAIRYYFDTLNN